MGASALHPETGWAATSTRDRGTGRQDRATGLTLCEDAEVFLSGDKQSVSSALWVNEVLNQIYEGDFAVFSYGFRPGRSAHNALDSLSAAIMTKKVNWIPDAGLFRQYQP
jgi:hypothetical protein